MTISNFQFHELKFYFLNPFLVVFFVFISTINANANYTPAYPYSCSAYLNLKGPTDFQNLTLEMAYLNFMSNNYVETHKLLSEVLVDMGFEITNQGNFDIKIKKVPNSLEMFTPLDSVLKLGGEIVIMIEPKQILGVITAYASKSGVYFDVQRFLFALSQNSLGLVGHEVTHYFHLNHINEKGPIDPFKNHLKSRVVSNDPSLSVYATGFLVSEIEAHFGDAILFQTHDHSKFSILDLEGKMALTYVMASKLSFAAKKVHENLITDLEGYVQFVMDNIQTDSILGIQYIKLPYTDENSNLSLLVFEMPLGSIEFNSILDFTQSHINYATDHIKKVETRSKIKDLDQALKIISQALKPKS